MSSTPPLLVVPASLAAQGRLERRAKRKRALASAAVMTLMLVLPLAWLVLARGQSPSDGTVTYPTDWSSTGVAVVEYDGRTVAGSSDCAGGVRSNDVVTSVQGRSFQDWLSGSVDDPAEDSALTFGVERGTGTCQETVDVGGYPWTDRIWRHALVFPLVALMWLMGAFVFLQRPRDPAARALFAIAVLVPWGATAWPFGIQVVDLVRGPRLWPYVIGDTAYALLWGAVLHFALVFPRPVSFLGSARTRVFVAYAFPFGLYGVSTAAHALVGLTKPDWTTLDHLGYLLQISVPGARVVPLVMACVIIWQYRHAQDNAERRRVRWVVVTLLLSASLYLGLGQLPDLFGDPLVPYDWLPVVFLAVPIALGVAVLQYGIFDLQILLRRSLVYGALTTILVAVPVVIGGALVAILGDPSSPSEPGTINVALGTALVAVVLFQTLRKSLKRRLSRLIFGARDDPYEVIGQLGGHLQARVPAEALLQTIAETLAHTLRLPYVAVEVVGPDGVTDIQTYGQPQKEIQAISLTSQGEEVGRLLLGTGNRSEPFGPADQRLLELLAQQVGIAAENVLLAGRLQRSLERAVSTREEERRRLRRDIHDGLGPMLAASRMRLEVAQQLMSTEPEVAEQLLRELVSTQQLVIDDVRRLVDDLRPPVLDQLGLVSAIRERAEAFSIHPEAAGGLEVTVDASEGLDDLPAAVEVAAYRIVLEALTNVARHAEARRCHVRMTRTDGVDIEVKDDGRGLPATYRSGVGLQSMRERASEMGGRCTITVGAPGGTVVRAWLPIHPS